ncbi:MAG: nuclear transport factor 2 family protein [Alphaproteobacteria bacterium]|jgi:ketosteroid isomerase-like protein|nr:nuclear transport factor 2 family protein [Alphaproteobacteria bacterium]
MYEKDAVLKTLEEYASAYCAKDIERLMSLFADGDDISLIGTGADELCSGRAAVKGVFIRNFAEATATKFEWHWSHVTVVGGLAVVAITLTIHLDTPGGKLQVPLRWTVSLTKDSGDWRWLHRHASAAATSQEEGTAYPAGGRADGK